MTKMPTDIAEVTPFLLETPIGNIGGFHRAAMLSRQHDVLPLTLLLHSSGGGAGSLKKCAELLDVSGDLLIPDLNGYGQSALKSDIAADIDAVEQHLLIISSLIRHYHQANQKIVLIGHSMGGFLSFKSTLSSRFPIAAIVAIEPVAFSVLDLSEDAQARSEDLDKVLALNAALQTDNYERELGEFIAYWGQVEWASLPEVVRENLLGQAAQVGAEALAVAHDNTSTSQYERLQQPVLLMKGSHTQLPASLVLQRLEALLPVNELVTIDKVGHMGPVQKPDEFADVINRFLAAQLA